MKGLAWTKAVSEVLSSINSTSPKEKQRLKKLVENYKELDDQFIKELKNQQDKEFVQLVLSWLEQMLFSYGWGYIFKKRDFNGKYKKDDPETPKLIKTIKTVKIAFKEFNFKPMYISIDGSNTNNPNYTFNKLLSEMGVRDTESKSTELKKASQNIEKFKFAKFEEGEKLPRKLKKAIKNKLANDKHLRN